MADLLMWVVAVPDPPTVTVLCCTTNPALIGDGPNNYLCGRCRAVLLRRVDEGSASRFMVRCADCHSTNSVDVAYPADQAGTPETVPLGWVPRDVKCGGCGLTLIKVEGEGQISIPLGVKIRAVDVQKLSWLSICPRCQKAQGFVFPLAPSISGHAESGPDAAKG